MSQATNAAQQRRIFMITRILMITATLSRMLAKATGRPEPLTEIDAWLQPYRKFWAGHLDGLELHPEAMPDAPVTSADANRASANRADANRAGTNKTDANMTESLPGGERVRT